MLKKLGYVLYLFTVVTLVLIVLEMTSQAINQSRDVDLPFFIDSNISIADLFTRGRKGGRNRKRYRNLDPHLGYARKIPENANDENSQTRYKSYQGFTVYGNKDIDNFDRPIILTLGGSTTDHYVSKDSWPKQLAKLLSDNQLSATVINGGNGGYSTNQELIKLIRDGLEFDPDLVISYSGANDRGAYSKLPYPMVHHFQRTLLSRMTEARLSPLLPNLVYLMSRGDRGVELKNSGYTYGIPTRRTLAQQYLRNHTLMKAISGTTGAEYLGILQPSAYVGNYDYAEKFAVRGKPKGYVKSLRNLYTEILDRQKTRYEVHNFIDIFNGIDNVYTRDGVHATKKGNRVIAKEIYDLIIRETQIISSD